MEKAGQDEPNLLVTPVLNRRMSAGAVVPVRQLATPEMGKVLFPTGKRGDVHLHSAYTLRLEDDRFLAGRTGANDHYVLAGAFSGHVRLLIQ
ncbi:MAG: hypothetical protein Q8R35_00775 [bacterium]|nr:hypothetical protein [bacterium]